MWRVAVCLSFLGACGGSTEHPHSSCGTLGEIRGEVVAPGALPDADDVAVGTEHVYVAASSRLYVLDHELAIVSGPVQLSMEGNWGLAHSATDRAVYAYMVARGNAQMSVYAEDGSTLLAGPLATNIATGGGFVDGRGHLHVPVQPGSGFMEYDASLASLGQWGQTTGGLDADLDPSTSIAWHLAPTSRVTGFDMDIRAEVAAFMLDEPGGIASAFDSRGTYYVLFRQAAKLVALTTAGEVLATASFAGEMPSTLAYDPSTDRLIVGFYESPSTATLRLVCPF